MSAPAIRAAVADDAPVLCAIYNHYVLTSAISFEEAPVSIDEMAARIRATSPWFVLEQDGVVAGYAYATPWRTRAAYRYSVESTVYVAPDRHGQGFGAQLYRALIAALRERGVHSVIGGIAQPNPASVALHEKLGFEQVALFREVGRKFDRWIDVGYWQLRLE
ncbi:MAG TPA: arsinothricin resistance N-acetyltransferase ArsN1 family B [Noviherbaspirillum sp.]|nr:arsinothricin resistance N-acetyltransferase ArsN1 family B [Noviherbaspirillum sp.]